MIFKQPKYRAKRTSVDGIMFHSKKEAEFYKKLLLEKAAGKITDIVLQPRFILQPEFDKMDDHYRKIEYVADFYVIYADGRSVIFDVKGMRTDVYKMKQKLFEYKFPHLHIVEV